MLDVAEGGPTPPERSYHAACIHKDQMIIVGGRDTADKELNDIFIFDLGNAMFHHFSTIESQYFIFSLVGNDEHQKVKSLFLLYASSVCSNSFSTNSDYNNHIIFIQWQSTKGSNFLIYVFSCTVCIKRPLPPSLNLLILSNPVANILC